jgi:methanogenic corrinoid protein MtbC1
MPVISRSPVYNLSVVLKETDLKADVLRAWERRYALPQPQRTSGGHRLYSDYDIQVVKWLRARQAEGLSIRRAVELWKEIITSGRDPLMDYSRANAPTVNLPPAADTRIEILRNNWLEACLAFDGRKAEELLNQAFAMHPVETVCTDILQRGMSGIGSDWYAGKTSAQQEHFVTAQAVRRLETLINATPPPTRPQTVLLGCPAGEFHTFPVLLLSLLLRRRGLKVVYLGADLPAEQMAETAAAIRPDLIVLAAQRLTTAATLQSAVRSLQSQGVPLAYGGLIFSRIPRLREQMPAHFLGESLGEAVDNIERLVAAPMALPAATSLDETRWALVQLYREKRPRIELAMTEELQKDGVQIDDLDERNAFLGSGLAAAFELGDPAFLEVDLAWVTGLLTGRHVPVGSLIPYLMAYSHAVRAELGEASAPVTAWIDVYAAQNEAALCEP